MLPLGGHFYSAGDKTSITSCSILLMPLNARRSTFRHMSLATYSEPGTTPVRTQLEILTYTRIAMHTCGLG